MRSVIVEGKDLHFRITENGTTRDMTANEASQFMKDVRSASEDGKFNDQLFKTIEKHKAINDARGNSHYVAEPRVGAGANHQQKNMINNVVQGNVGVRS